MIGRKQLFLILTFFIWIVASFLGDNRGAKGSTQDAQSQITIREAAFLAHTTPGAGAATPAKLCSAVHALNARWRDTIIAPDNWGRATCQNFANSLGTREYQLGCVNPGSFSWGDNKGSMPQENQCKW